MPNKVLGGGFKYCLFSPPIWGRFPIWLIFFRWVGSTTNQSLVFFVAGIIELPIYLWESIFTRWFSRRAQLDPRWLEGHLSNLWVRVTFSLTIPFKGQGLNHLAAANVARANFRDFPWKVHEVSLKIHHDPVPMNRSQLTMLMVVYVWWNTTQFKKRGLYPIVSISTIWYSKLLGFSGGISFFFHNTLNLVKSKRLETERKLSERQDGSGVIQLWWNDHHTVDGSEIPNNHEGCLNP